MTVDWVDHVVVWNRETGKQIEVLQGHDEKVLGVGLNPANTGEFVSYDGNNGFIVYVSSCQG
jgi:WD40 repeat protein